MQVKPYFVSYLCGLALYLLFDAIWLGFIARADYQASIGFLMRESVPLWPWVSFYLLYVIIILKLCVFSGGKLSALRTVLHGICLGAASYGAYNLTNYAIIEGWPLSIMLKDWIWGIFVTTSSAVAAYIGYKVSLKRVLANASEV